MILNSPYISGSLTVTGNIVASGSITLSGSVASASFAANAATASFVTLAQTASFVTTAQTASFVANAQSASNAVTAQTASFANAFTVAGTLTAQTLVVQTITSSVDFVTGSTRFGTLLSNTHVFSGSVTMNPGGLFVSSSGNVGIGTTAPLGSSVERTIHLSDGGAGYTTLYVTNGTNSLRGIFAVSNPLNTISIGTQTNTDLRIVTNDSTKMFISSSGAVGIGVTSITLSDVMLEIYKPAVANNWSPRLVVRDQNSASFLGVYAQKAGVFAHTAALNGWADLYINTIGDGAGAGNNGAVIFGGVRITSNGELGVGVTPTSGNRFWVRGSSSSSSDTSIFVQNSTPSTLFSVRNDGVVTKPLQPSFRAGRSTSYVPGATTPIVFNSTSGFGFNVGGNYSTSTGRFTAPINGIYNFTTCVIWESVSNGQGMDDAFEIKVNGSTAAYSFRRATYVTNTTGIGGYYVDHATALLNLTAGQYVEVVNRYAGLTVHGNQNYCYFQGYLVG